MALPVFRAAGTKTSGTTSGSPTVPSGIQSGDVVWMIATTITGGSISITVTGGWTWNLASGFPLDSGGEEMLYAWWSRYTGSETAPTLQAASDHMMAQMAAWSGCIASGTPFEALESSYEVTSDTSLSFATANSTSGADRLCICCCS